MQANQDQSHTSIEDEMFKILTANMSSVVRIEDVKPIISSIVQLLAPRRKEELLKHLKFCKKYKELHEKGMPETRLRSTMLRKFKISRTQLYPNCERCQKIIEYDKAKKGT